ncbi:MAG: helix-turn-helix domain-containing protein [Gammaproteobacteria bacterium]|nr:helix-turn-helix domain-containing protein [Gammaproteobacteria bacterium]
MGKLFHYTSSGLDGVWLRNGFTETTTPYGKAVSIHNIEGLHRAIGLDIVCRKSQLQPNEVRFLRKELNLSQTHLARILGVSETTARNWESEDKGRARIPGPADRILRALYRESVQGDGKILEMLESISDLDEETGKNRIELEETESGWTAKAAA